MVEASDRLVLIVIDGLDASGKSTQATYLCELLRNNRRTVLLRIHPSDDNFFGVRAKRFLKMRGKSAHFTSAFFYMLDVIRSILLYSWQKYDYTIFVRYLMGTAYLPSPVDRISYQFFASIVPTSNFMFFLDVQPEEAVRRMKLTRTTFEMFENLNELKKIRKKALSLTRLNNWQVIDAGKTVKEVENEITNVLFNRSKNNGV